MRTLKMAIGLLLLLAAVGCASGDLGDLCDSNDECNSDLFCVQTEVMRGQCSASCTYANGIDSCQSEFGSGAFCLGAAVCAQPCGDCPSDTQCNEFQWCQR